MNGNQSQGPRARTSAFRHGLKAPKWSSIAVALLAMALLSLYLAVPAGALGSSTFVGTDGTLDAGAAGLVVKNDTPSGSGDDSFGEGVHEDTAVPPIETGSVPDKADLKTFHMAIEKAGGQDYLYLSWERKPDQGGSTDMDFEFNQSSTISANGVTPVRTVNDLLITYAIANGGSTVEMAYRLWEGSDWGSEHVLGAFAEGSFNTDPDTGDHYFGEAVINLTSSGLFPTGQCVNFGSAYLKSRSSQSFESKMKDFIAPAPIFISNCGKVVIHKDTVPNVASDFSFTTTGTGLSSFSLDDDGDATLSNTKTFVDLLPGAYSVTEAAAAGYDLTSLTCTATTGSSGTRSGLTSTVNISVVAGSIVDCTFVNTQQPAHLNVIKNVINDNGGTSTSSDFVINVDADGATPDSFLGLESPGISVTLNAGSFSVTETEHSGYLASYVGCSGTIAPGETKTCTITNNDQPPGLKVIKHVINDNGGTKTADDFTINVTGTLPTPASFSGAEDGTDVTINAGSYSVAEGDHAGYAVTYSADCTGSIAVGQTKTCTVTNNDIQPKLTVIKNVINDNGGTKTAADFTMNVTAPGDDPAPFPGSAAGTEVGISAGAYSVVEGAHDGYSVTYSTDCEGSIGVGGTKTCTVTNNDIQPLLIIKKEVVNDNGGTLAAGAFTLNVTGASPVPASVTGSEDGAEVAINAGGYSVLETPVDGYVASYSDNCSGTISAGQVRTCTVTNNDVAPGLTVIKHVINDNGGDKDAGDFDITVTGTSVDPDSFAGSENGTSVALKAGAFSVTETEVDGYAATYSADCTGSIAIGQSKVCTITNNDIQPRLTVIKTVDNDNGGTLAAGDFTMNVTGDTPVPASFAGSAVGTEVAINAGAYEVTELEVAGYAGTFSDDCKGTLEIGDAKTCTVTNSDIQPELTVIKHVINDNGGTKTAADFDLGVTGPQADPATFEGDEEGVKVHLNAGSYAVAETADAGYLVGYSADCTGTIAIGQAKECTVTNNDIQPNLTVIKNVVNDNGGTKAPADFTLDVAGGSPVPASFAGSAGTEVTLDAGSYSVTEDEVDGYAGTFSEGCSGVLAPGETATCTVTNDDLTAGLTVVKRVVNDNGGTKDASDFEISVVSAGTDPAPFEGSETGTVLEINAGAYEVSEEEVDGYEGTLSEGCEGTIALDEAVVCTITNDDVQPVLNVIKRVVNDDGGNRTASSFTMLVAGGTPASFPGNENGTKVGINAGAYVVNEADPGRYTQSKSADCTGSIAAGQTKTCTITNNDSPAEVAGVVIENTPAETVQVLGIELPRTGLNIGLGLMVALALIGGGFGFLWWNRRTQAAKG